MSPISILRLSILIVVSTLFIGCASLGSLAPSSSSLPEWVKSLPQDNEAFYATGEGISLKEAEQNARVSMAAQLKSQVNDQYRLLQVSDGKFSRDYIEQHTSVEVSDMILTHAQVVKQQKQGLNFYVLLKLHKQAFVAQQRVQLNSDVQKLGQALQHAKGNSFDQWWVLRQHQSIASRVLDNMVLLNTLTGQEFPAEQRRVKRYFKRMDESYEHRRLSLRNNTQVEGLTALVEQQLEKEMISVEPLPLWRKVLWGPDQASIELTTNFQTRRVASETYINGALWVRLRSNGGQVLSQFKIEASTVSIQGAEAGKVTANRKLYQKMQKVNIIEKLISEA